MIFPTISVPIRSVKTMVSGVKKISQRVLDMARIKRIYFVAKHVIKGFQRTVTLFSCTPTITRRPFNGLFWPLLSVTVFGGQQGSLSWTRTALTVWSLKPESIARSSLEI